MLAWLRGSQSRPPMLLKLRSSKQFIIATVAFSIFTDIFAYSVVVPVFPFALTSRAGVDADDVQQWTSVLLAVYGAALLITSPIFGWISDRMGGRQKPFMMGLVLLAGATVMLCVGNSLVVYAIGRVLQGASAAVVWVVGLALLVDTVGTEEVGAAMGYISPALSVALLLGPLLGGIVFARASYYAVYAMVFALIGLDIFMRFAMIERSSAAAWSPEEEALSEKFTSGTPKRIGSDDAEVQSAHVNGSNELAIESNPSTVDGSAPKASLNQNLSNAAGALSPSVTGRLQSILKRLPPVVLLFGSRRFLNSLWATMIVSTFFTAYDSILPLYVKGLFHWNSLGAGLIFLPICLATLIGPVVGHFTDRSGPRWLAAAGFLLICPVLILMRLVDHDSIKQKVLLCFLLTFLGLGLDLSLTPIMAEVAYVVEAKAARRPPGFYGKHGATAQAYALFNTAWAAGNMIGPLLGGFVNESQGWATTNLILGCVAIFTAIPVVVWTGGSIFKKRETQREAESRQAVEEEK